ncbi:MAG: hypothetical protein OEU51_09860 [Gammaproteobacteria bacterium]|nr:hypothetical protein [Gammaproteobacteria bacterium]
MHGTGWPFRNDGVGGANEGCVPPIATLPDGNNSDLDYLCMLMVIHAALGR